MCLLWCRKLTLLVEDGAIFVRHHQKLKMFGPVRLSPSNSPGQRSHQGNTMPNSNAQPSRPTHRRGFAGIDPATNAGQALLSMEGRSSRRAPRPSNHQPSQQPIDVQVTLTQMQSQLEYQMFLLEDRLAILLRQVQITHILEDTQMQVHPLFLMSLLLDQT